MNLESHPLPRSAIWAMSRILKFLSAAMKCLL
jgi:hypothetical protein